MVNYITPQRNVPGRCRDCFYWEDSAGFGKGEPLMIPAFIAGAEEVRSGNCHRYANATHGNREDDWCGDFKAVRI